VTPLTQHHEPFALTPAALLRSGYFR